MLDRLVSFIKSGKKQAILRYYFYETKGRAGRLVHGLAGKGHRPVGTLSGKLNLGTQANRMYGFHRSGWRFAVESLKPLDNPRGTIIDTFIDRTFASDVRRKTTYREPWIGFIHVPPKLPSWLDSPQSNEVIFNSPGWKESLPFCRGLFTLSGYHRDLLAPLFPFPVESLLHPTEFPALAWNWERFSANPDKKIVQTGWWLRMIYSLVQLEVPGYRKVILKKFDADMAIHLKMEKDHMPDGDRITDAMLGQVAWMKYLSDRKYDQLLSENIVFLDLVDASANNAIIECIARNTPVLVNPLPAVMEYLGADYPFYYTSLAEAARKAADSNLVQRTHLYLVNSPVREKLTGEYFRRSLQESVIYRSL